jgi:hypothetical protein
MMETQQQFPLFETADEQKLLSQSAATEQRFSDYIVYVDESDDHGLVSVDEEYPVFVLAFCVFHKRHYSEQIIPAIEKFKFNYFGHDSVVLHESDIRKQKGAFSLLNKLTVRTQFMNDLSGIIEKSNFILMGCVIDKKRLRRTDGLQNNPYHLALEFCLETLHQFLQEKKQAHLRTHVVVECRGRKEDSELELEFLRFCSGENRKSIPMPFDVVFADKKTNATGLQFADLVARPIGLNYFRPEQANRAFEQLTNKFYCRGGRSALGVDYEGYGLKIYPPVNDVNK